MMWPWRRTDPLLNAARLETEAARLAAVRDRLIETVAAKVIGKRLETPAIFFLEMNRPLTFIAGQAALVASPLLGALVPPQDIEDFARLMEDRSNVDRLIEIGRAHV